MRAALVQAAHGVRQMDYRVSIHEGWAFVEEAVDGKSVKHYHKLLRAWAQGLWDIRKGFRDASVWRSEYARSAAEDAVKNVLNMTIGVTK